jgi:hypothetical protein
VPCRRFAHPHLSLFRVDADHYAADSNLTFQFPLTFLLNWAASL